MKTRFTPWVVRTTLALLFLGGLINSSINAQCAYTHGPGTPPYNLSVTMSGSTAILDSMSLSPILGTSLGYHIYYEYPAGTLHSTDTLDCSQIGSSFFIVVRGDDNGTIDAMSCDTIHVNITLIDISPPSITCPGNYVTVTSVDTLYDCFATGLPIDATVTDNCNVQTSYTVIFAGDTIAVGNDNSAGSEFFPVGVSTVTYTTQDLGGTTSTCSFTVTVTDDEDPIWLPSVITYPGVITQSLDSTGTIRSVVLDYSCTDSTYQALYDSLTLVWLPDAIDNCDSAVVVAMTSMQDTTFNCATVLGVTNVYAVKTIFYSATDASGNVASPPFALVIYTADHQGPSYSGVGAIVPSGPAVESPIGSGFFTGPNDTLFISDFDTTLCGINFANSSLLANPVDCHNVTDTSWTITALGSTPPPAVGSGNGNNPSQSNFLSVGSYIISYSAADSCDNVSNYSFTLFINDDVIPTVTGCPANISGIPNEAGNCYATVDWTKPTAADNCTPVVMPILCNFTDPVGNTFPIIKTDSLDYGFFPVGVNTVNYVFVGDNNDTTTCTFTVTVVDVERPHITCGGNQTLNSICSSILVSNYSGLVSVYDNCPNNVLTIMQSPAAGTLVSSIPVVLVDGATFPVMMWVVDSSGNTSDTCSFIVTLSDQDQPIPVLAVLPAITPTMPPSASCGFYDLYAPIAIECNGDTVYGQASIAGATYHAGPPPYYTLTPNNYVINWIYDDGSGNIATQIQTVQVIADTIDPVITCPADLILSADLGLCSRAGVTYSADSLDNCVVTMTYSPASGSTFVVGTTTVTATATDASGNSSTCTFNVIIEDNEDPVITCPANIAVNADPALCTAVVSFTATATDNCGAATVTYSPASGSAFPVGITTVTATATDNSSNTSTCTFSVTVTDNQLPVITCPPNITVNNSPGLCSNSSVVYAPATATDNCSIATITYSKASGTSFNVGTTTVTATATDNHGNTATCQFTVTVVDAQAPVFTYCPTNKTLPNLTGDCENYVTWERPSLTFFFGPDVTDNCTNAFNLNITETISNASVQAAINLNAPYTPHSILNTVVTTTFPVGVTYITYLATDASGNTAVCTFTVTIVDTEAPTLTCSGAQSLNSICDSIRVPDYSGLANIFDNCPNGVYTVTQIPPAGTLLDSLFVSAPMEGSTFTVTLTVTDSSGNVSNNCSFTVTLHDFSEPIPAYAGPVLPTINPGNTPSASCGFYNLYAPIAFDCPNDTIYGTASIAGATYTAGPPPYYTLTPNNYVINWIYDDGNGNLASQLQTVQVIADVVPPVITCPANIVLIADAGQCSRANVTYAATFTDNCVTTLTYSPASGSTFAVGTTTVTATATDASGNSSTCQFTVTINDAQAPIITCPTNITVSADPGLCSTAVSYAASATDNCGVSSITYSPVSGSIFPVGTTTVTATATDAAGNTASCTFTVRVNDTQAPVITCPANITVNNTPGLCSNVNVAYPPATATDNCAVATITYSKASGTSFNVGVTTVTATATDVNGNTATCQFTVTVKDNESPIFTYCPPNKTYINLTGDCENFVSWERPSLTFLFGPDVVDNCSSSANLNITETISDASVQSAITNNYPYNPHSLLNTTVATSFPVGSTVVTYVATDQSGNTAVCSFIVTIYDVEAPTVSNPGPQVLPSICVGATVPNYLSLVNVFDNCQSQLSVVQNPAPGTPIISLPGISNPPLDGQTFSVTITATNINPLGLSGSATFTVTLDDQQNPVPNIPGPTLPPANSTCGSLTLNAPSANDCGITIYGIPNTGMFVPFSSPPQYTFGIGSFNVLWTYIDAQNNISVQSQLVTVSADVTPPTILCPNDLTVFTPSIGCTVVSNMTMTEVFNILNVVKGTYFDLCGVVSVTYSLSGATTLAKKPGNNNNTVTEALNLGLTSVTYYIKDAVGNETTCTTTITVKDNVAPILSGVPANITVECNNVPGVPGAGVVTASDNCTASPVIVFTPTSTQGGNPAFCSFYTYVITRTWLAIDGSGNTSQQIQTITVHDTSVPTFNVNFPVDITVNTDVDLCTKNLTLVVNSTMVSDVCAPFANLIKTNSFNGGGANASGIYPIGVTVVVFTFMDPCGNTASKSVKVTVQDHQAPNPACVLNVAVPVGASGSVPLNPNSFNAGSYDNCGPVTLSLSPASVDCDDVGHTIQVILTVTDQYGNSATCQTFVEVQDNVNPSITCPADVTIGCGNTLDPNLNPNLGLPTVSDNCVTNVSYTDSNANPPVGACAALNRTWKVTDAFNNSNICVQRIIIQDLVAPSLIGLPSDVTLACGATIPAPPVVTATDFCDPSVPVTFIETSSKTNNNSCSDFSYVVTRTWVAADDCNNTTVYTQKTTVLDNAAPVFSNMPGDITLFTENFNSLNCSAPVTLALTSSNVSDCQGFANLTIINNSPYGTGGASASGTYPVGVVSVKFTATDKCGNSSMATIKVTVIDNSKPTAKCDDILNVGLNASGIATVTGANVDEGSVDNCTPSNQLILTLSKSTFDCSNFGNNLISMTVTDLAGNTNVCTSIINIQDNILPVISCPADVTVNCTNSLDPNVNLGLGKATATDNCTSSVLYTDASTTPTAGFCSALIRTWKVTDVAGNTATCTQRLSILDNTPPSFTGSLPVDVTLTCGSTVPAAPTVLATDFCDPSVTVVLTETSTKTNNSSCSDFSYIVTRTWKATDDCGNTSTYTQKTTVLDNAGPSFSNMPAPITLFTQSFNSLLCSAPFSLNLTSSNISDCEGFSNLTITNNGPIGNGGTDVSGTYPVGVYSIKFTATDKCGNSSSATVSLTVVDNSKPIAKCHDVVNVSVNNSGIATVTPQNIDNGSIDNCTPSNQLVLSLNLTSFNCSNLGNNLVVLTVIDQAGNSNVCTSIITIQDNILPIITSCPGDISVNCTSSLDPNVNLSLGKATATDNCSATISYTDVNTSPSAGFCSALIRTWKATDAGNNTATCTQKISIQDNTPPTFTSVFPPDVTLACGSIVPAAPSVTATDFCDPSVAITLNEVSTKTNNNTCTDFSYIVTRTWVATDDCGNTASHTQKTTVLDNAAPVFSNMPGPITLFTQDFNSLLCSAPVVLTLTNSNISDCEGFGNLTVTNNSPFGSGGANASGTYPVGTTAVKFTATDKCGNSSMATVNVTVVDNSKPIAHCHAFINITLNNQGIATLAPQDVNDGSTDNCTPQNQLLLSLNQTFFDCTNLGSNTVILTVTDQAGNSNTCTSVINVVSGSSTTLTLTFSTTNETAPGANDGSATAIVTGGSGSFSYKWNDPNNSTTQTVNGLAAGNYTVTVTDLVTGCKIVGTVTVNLSNSSSNFTISGNIMVPVTNANVGLVQVDMTGTTLATMTTTNNGNYSFTVPAFSNVTVKPLKNIFQTNGVTALDMAIIQQHVTNPMTPTLTTPYMLIAGDMNHDGLINGIDLAVGQAVILGNLSSFPNNTSWVFVPKSYVFPNPLNPFIPAYPTSLSYTNLASNQINQNYWGIKIGDVQYSAMPAQANGGNEVRDYVDELKFVSTDKNLTKGATIHLDFTSENFKDILAYQFTMEADPEYLEIVETTAGVLPGMNKDFFGMNKSSEGSFTAVWYNNDGYNLYPKDNAFGLTLKVKKTGKKLSECLKLSDKQIITTGYNSNYKPVEIGLKFNSDVITNPVHQFELYQNQPNPFKNTTTISFSLPAAERGNIQIMDLNGKIIKSIEKNFEKGINREEVQLENVSPGVFYYKVSTSSHSAIKKMVLID